jgi:cell wall-associated NlpC family hydrolase
MPQMKQLIYFFCMVIYLLALPVSTANIMTKNAAGITITFLDAAENTVAQEVLLSAMSLEGIKYKYGGSSPETGFDCSGFVNYVYHKAANLKLPRTSRGISRVGRAITNSELQVGDLVFFNTTKKPFSHVGIYVGDGKFIHAPRTGSFVRVESMRTSYWKNRFNGAKRLDQATSN